MTQARVGGAPEPDGDQPMTDAELRVVREHLGLSGEWLAQHLGVQLRTVRRWEAGDSPIPDGVRVQVEELEADAVEQANALAAALGDVADLVLTIPRGDGDMPAGWWRAIAYEVAAAVPGLHIRYDDGSGGA